MATTYGWTGQILWVDLTDRKVSKVPTSDFEPEKYIGGVGLNTKIFWELGSPRVNAFNAANPLLISIGPLTGASGPFNRSEVGGIAPQTYPQELFNYSGFGGKFSSELKYAGYDGIVILGKADKPVYLSIHDKDVEIKDAGHLWGLDTFETQQTLMESHPKSSVLTIGPAGENLSRIAIILNETASAAGQGGYGAVMGSKNLKAIALRGTGTLKLARPDEFMSLLAERKAEGEWVAGDWQQWGRYILVGGDMAQEMTEKHLKRFAGCHGCPFQCMGFYDIPGVGKGGQMCTECWYGYYSSGSSKGMWEGNIMSQKLGINNQEMLAIMSFIMGGMQGKSVMTSEGTTRKPFFTAADLGLPAIPLYDFGELGPHHQFLDALLGGIADGTSPFHQGLARAAPQFGSDAVDLYNHICPANGYRSHHIEGISMALHWATDTRDPVNSNHDYVHAFAKNETVANWFGVPGGYIIPGPHRNVYEGTEKEVWWVQSHQCLKNSLPICEWASLPVLYFHPPKMDIRIFESKILEAVTGIYLEPDELWETGERIWTLRRAIMVSRENRTREYDTLSHVWFEKIAGGDQVLAAPIDATKWEALKDRYYELLGWDTVNGWPTRARLEQLGMKGVADTLQSAGKLGL